MSDIEKLIGKTLSESKEILDSENIIFKGEFYFMDFNFLQLIKIIH